MSDRILVLVSLRGGVDAINAVVPHGDPDYYRLRPTLAIPRPKTPGAAALDLDGFYGFHPALKPLLALWERRELAVVHAVGWPGVSHSHFEAWEEIESGAVGEDRPQSGWLARALAAKGDSRSPLRAVAFADTLPRLLTGALGATVLTSLEEYRLAAAADRRGRFEHALRALYARTAFPVGAAGLATLDALTAIERVAAGRTGDPPEASPFARQLGMIARLVQANVGLEAASAELNGWDLHFAEGSTSGAMARHRPRAGRHDPRRGRRRARRARLRRVAGSRALAPRLPRRPRHHDRFPRCPARSPARAPDAGRTRARLSALSEEEGSRTGGLNTERRSPACELGGCA